MAVLEAPISLNDEQAVKNIGLIGSQFKMNLWMMANLPLARKAGLKVTSLDAVSCEVQVPYKHTNKNPFKSTYFAVLTMAAEMSTGSLCMAYLRGRNPSISMLLVDLRGNFSKKAVGVTTFTCEEGQKVVDALNEAHAAEDGCSTVELNTIGRNEEGEVLCEFTFNWSFKVRRS